MHVFLLALTFTITAEEVNPQTGEVTLTYEVKNNGAVVLECDSNSEDAVCRVPAPSDSNELTVCVPTESSISLDLHVNKGAPEGQNEMSEIIKKLSILSFRMSNTPGTVTALRSEDPSTVSLANSDKVHWWLTPGGGQPLDSFVSVAGNTMCDSTEPEWVVGQSFPIKSADVQWVANASATSIPGQGQTLDNTSCWAPVAEQGPPYTRRIQDWTIPIDVPKAPNGMSFLLKFLAAVSLPSGFGARWSQDPEILITKSCKSTVVNPGTTSRGHRQKARRNKRNRKARLGNR